MSHDRRPQLAQRRRRVIYAHGVGTETSQSPAAFAAAREARRPVAPYGSRVQRRLRARWFGLVPVRRRTMSAVIVTVLSTILLLTLAHWFAIRWPPLAYAPDLSRPLRLDHADSFGTWLRTILCLSGAGAALLIYQLRRHRSDDYEGRYRIWRPVILLMVIASIQAVTGFIDWAGFLIDAALGERKALAGGDWMRLIMAVGGAALGLRLIAEVWQSRLATPALIAGLLSLGYPAAVHWKLMTVESPLAATFYSAAPLLGWAGIWIALVAYLRLLYREVRRIDENDHLGDRLRQWNVVRYWNAEQDETDEQETKDPAAKTGRRTAAKAKTPAAKPAATVKAAPEKSRRTATRPAADKDADLDDDSETTSETEKPRRRWLGLRKPAVAKSESPESEDKPSADSDPESGDTESEKSTAKRSWFGRKKAAQNASEEDAQTGDVEAESPAAKRSWFKRKKAVSEETDLEAETEPNPPSKRTVAAKHVESNASENTDHAEDEDAPAKTKRGWFRRGKADANAENESTADAANQNASEDETSEDEEKPKKKSWLSKLSLRLPPGGKSNESDDEDDQDSASKQSQPNDDDSSQEESEEYIDPDSIDWDSLNKAERRRLKRQLKRQSNAA